MVENCGLRIYSVPKAALLLDHRKCTAHFSKTRMTSMIFNVELYDVYAKLWLIFECEMMVIWRIVDVWRNCNVCTWHVGRRKKIMKNYFHKICFCFWNRNNYWNSDLNFQDQLSTIWKTRTRDIFLYCNELPTFYKQFRFATTTLIHDNNNLDNHKMPHSNYDIKQTKT